MTEPITSPLCDNALLEQIFSIPLEEEKYIVYAPLKGVAFIANPALVNALVDQCRAEHPQEVDNSSLEFLHRLDFFSPAPPPVDEYAKGGVAYDTVVLFATNQCNLRCAYCYASSGEFRPKMMSWEVAQAAVDRVMDDVLARGGTEMTLGFHGGGGADHELEAPDEGHGLRPQKSRYEHSRPEAVGRLQRVLVPHGSRVHAGQFYGHQSLL